MAFIPAKRPIVAFPISVSVYTEDGSTVELSFTAQYRRAQRQELTDLNDGAVNHGLRSMGREPIEREDGKPIPAWPYDSDDAFLVDRMVGWSGVQNASGGEKPFSKEALAEVLSDYPELVPALFRGFFKAHEGAREKN
ncbi:hypothetical protein ERD78_18865 [Allopusillimonas soli]|uniref:Tail assembly chaperone n=1 Tax=Allopusillimonas soli TaxID=659016 RepID=A0A853FJF6_9BURK|nr:phage tail assembly chaperone [Allopusillimonas soli]NYT38870.1 hypothetical protein [Allopusillimonas soli]TEA70131.1 hypothetical protein ERD78_18865 [Allopusillimonas soli]